MESVTCSKSKIEVSGRELHVSNASGSTAYPIGEMSEKFFNWQREARLAIYEAIASGEPRHFSAHLPVVVTYSEDRIFPFHTATKGVGMLPKVEYIDEYIDSIKTCLADAASKPWEESQEDRIATSKRFYENTDHIERRSLGLIEIFRGQTYRNIQNQPLAAIHYTGSGPEYPSFQLNGVIEMIEPGDSRFDFLRHMRLLFEHNSFHIPQPDYPSGYLFWVSEVLDKTPVKRTKRTVQ